MIVRSTLLTAAALLTSSLLPAQRLPTGVHPEHYTLALTPDLQAASFAGTETIDLTLDAPATAVTLNAAEIKILSVTAAGQTAAVSYDEPKEQATFTFPQPLPAGAARLAISYTGILNSKLRGFYLSKTKARNYAVTQFEPTDARRAFPSFDEPAYKATYDISLTVDAPDTVISNGALLSDKPAGAGKHTLTFTTTPKMSSYLVAFLVGDFQCTTGKADGVPIRVCSTPDKVQFTRFGLEAAEYILPYYDKYFGIKYPMPKLDLIALPDFEAGAMENFGCITYRETDLLVDKDASINAKKRVASVVAHEMAHQWFGDMVTMQWWDNLWLNEGFATWMQTKPVAAWHPEWLYPEDDANTLDATLNLDAQPTTHPIRARDTETPAQINELFDGISYGKGGAVLGMVEHYLGPEVFRQGVHNYLQAHLYANATAEDFWNAQTATSHQPVDRIMSSFIDQPGVPLVSFTDDATGHRGVTQSRFFLAPRPEQLEISARNIAQQWTIPLCIKTLGEPHCDLIAPLGDTSSPNPSYARQASAGSPLPFFFANAGDQGYYRSLYTPAQLTAIASAAETSLTPPERVGLLGDQYAFVRSGQTPVGNFLDLVFALKADPSDSVLRSALQKTGSFLDGIATPEDADRLSAIFLREFGPIYRAIGKPGRKESYNDQERRTLLFAALGGVKDPAILSEARLLSSDAFTSKRPADPALTDAAVSIAAANGDAAFYDRLQAVAENSPDPGMKTDALHDLATFQAPELATRTLDYAASGKVRNQDAANLFATMIRNPKTREIAWPYVQGHWDAVSAQFTTNSGVRVVAATGSFCSAAQHDEVKTFFATHHVEASDRTLAKALDSIDDCTRRRATQEPALHAWLAAHSTATAGATTGGSR